MKRLTVAGGIVLTLLLCAGSGEARMVAISAPEANIRETPRINDYNLYLRAPRYYPLEVIDKQGEFLKVRDFNGHIGWISSAVVDNTRAVVVSAKQANLREGPDTQLPVVLRAERGVCFKVLSVKGEWVQLEHASGRQGWMHRSLLWGL